MGIEKLKPRTTIGGHRWLLPKKIVNRFRPNDKGY